MEAGGARKHAITARASVWALAVELMLQEGAEPLWYLFLTNECDPELFVEVLEVRILFSLGTFFPLFSPARVLTMPASAALTYSILKTCEHT